jgi:CRP-like cAMP-binding protein
MEPATYIVREGEEPQYCALMISGFSFRHKITGEGGRQIMAIHMAGEFVDLQNMFLQVSDHNVQALTRAEVAFIPRPAINDLVMARPALAKAMWLDTLIDASIFREWVVNVGRRDALSRVAHLMCELSLRLEAAGLAHDHRYELPMTQEQIADATGLTPVHVNRVLKEMDRQGFIVRNRRSVAIEDWERMRTVGDFNSRYLHLEQTAPVYA